MAGERPRNVGWLQAAGLLFGDWGTSRLYVLGLAFFFAGRSSFYLICLMSLLILAVGWAYTHICRIYPDGGGVYTAAKSRSRMLAVVGALLLFADYTVTASLSALDAFHYFGLPLSKHVERVESHIPADIADPTEAPDAGNALEPHRAQPASASESLFAIDSPALWTMVAIGLIGLFNLMGPKHTGRFALAAAIGMVGITLLITFGSLSQVDWKHLPNQIGDITKDPPAAMWMSFVSIVLALSGVEAIANLTGVMKRPVAHTARKAIWVVAIEVAVFNILLAVCMLAIVPPVSRDKHLGDMMAFITERFMGPWGTWVVRSVGGLLLLSAANTAITDMISVQYLMARDGELPRFLQSLNRFGVPWVPAIIAAGAPVIVLLFVHDLDRLAALYAIGVVGAVAINVTLCAMHPRLRRMRRKAPMIALGVVLLGIWVSLAYVKREALMFVTIVMVVGLLARALTKWWGTRKGPKPSLIRQAIAEQLTPEALGKRKILVGTYGSEALAEPALAIAKPEDMTLVVCFIRQIRLSIKWETQFTIDTDLAARRTFAFFLDKGHELGVPVICVYDTGSDAAVLLAENAAINGCERVIIGTSRQGAVYHLIKGSFQRRLESLLPPEIPVQIVASVPEPPSSERIGERSPVR
ncbi:MAG: universal stress protein [Planctomycetota bacterium]|nr:universal stress protein [Planctomycetota bacterium]